MFVHIILTEDILDVALLCAGVRNMFQWKRKKMNKQLFTALYVGFIVCAVGFMGFATWFILTNYEELSSNPFVYGAKKMGGVSCSCTQINLKEKTFVGFGFNDTAFWQMGESQIGNYLMPLNLEGLNLTYADISKRGQGIENQSRDSNRTGNS